MIDLARPSPCWSDSELYRKLMADDRWVAEPKYDGWRCLMRVDHAGPRLFTRRGKQIFVRPQMEERLRGLKLPPGTELDGEWMGARQELVLWDVPTMAKGPNGQMLWRRREQLLALVPQVGPVRAIQRLHKDNDTLRRALDAGYEGVVLKDNHSTYPRGKTTSWVKVKG